MDFYPLKVRIILISALWIAQAITSNSDAFHRLKDNFIRAGSFLPIAMKDFMRSQKKHKYI